MGIAVRIGERVLAPLRHSRVDAELASHGSKGLFSDFGVARLWDFTALALSERRLIVLPRVVCLPQDNTAAAALRRAARQSNKCFYGA